ncbi:MAG: hypothetical protein ACBZ72_01770 [Candidatus Bathyarchaeia archaeon]
MSAAAIEKFGVTAKAKEAISKHSVITKAFFRIDSIFVKFFSPFSFLLGSKK